jgi:hypothetical protein
VENINITEQLNKFKNLINAKSGEVISEQTDPRQLADSIYREIWNAVGRDGTDEQLLVKAIQRITSLQLYNAVNGLLAKNPPGDGKSIVAVLNDELGEADASWATAIQQALAKIGKNITFQKSGINVVPNSFKVVGTAAVNTPATVSPMEREQYWKTTFSCATQQPGAKAYKLKDGTTAYNVGGIFYYNNGRKKLADGTMANYSCKTEFKSNSDTQQRRVKRNSGLAQRFAKSAQSLGIQNGKMNVDTLQKILASLEGPAAKPKTASDFSPQGVTNDANPNELQGATTPTVVAQDYEGIQQFVNK